MDYTQYMLTTPDNPFNPWTQFDEWYTYDSGVLKYDTLPLLARVARSSDELSEADQHVAINDAMDDIVSMTHGFYRKVPQPVSSTTQAN